MYFITGEYSIVILQIMTKFLLNQAIFAALAIFLKYASAECDDIAPPCPTDGLLLLQHLSCVEIGNVTLATAAYRCDTFCHKFVGKSLYHYSDGEWTDLEECPRCESKLYNLIRDHSSLC